MINDRAGFLDVVLIGDAAEQTVRAYESRGQVFAATGSADRLRAADGEWIVSEAALLGPQGQHLRRLPGHIGYRFAWEGYFGAGVVAR